MTVEQFLCAYTSGTGVNPANVSTTTFTSNSGGAVCGVFYFGTGTGNAYIQDPFAPFNRRGGRPPDPSHVHDCV